MPRTRVPRQGSTAAANDYTGRERDRLAQEKLEEIAEAQTRTGLMNKVDTRIEEEGVFDARTQVLVEAPEGVEEALDRIQYVTDPDDVIDASTDAAATKRIEPVDPFKDLKDPVTQQAPRKHLPSKAEEVQDVIDRGEAVIVAEPETEIIMVNADIEDMTYGVGNNYTFVQGRKYRVPKDVADWLDDKGLLYYGRR